ncbi:hypothetical protein FF2_006962 [Malus domestica]
MSPRLLRHRFPDLLFLPRLFFSVTAAKRWGFLAALHTRCLLKHLNMEKFPLCLKIGRDLVRLLQDLVHLPKFRAIWKDLVLNRGEFKAQGFSVGKPEASSGMVFLESDVIPRWAVMGWYFKSCTKNYVEANVKLALLYDWLFFEERVDNIMDIEPAMLLMVYSIPRYIDVTHTILEFFFLLMDNYDVEHYDILAKGVSSSFSVLVKRGVIRSFDVLTSCDALSPILKERLGRFLSRRKFEISKEVQQACRPGDFVSLNSSCMETPLPLTEWQPKCSQGDRFGTKLAETKVMISDDAAPSHSPLVVAREGQVHDIDNLIHNLGEAIKNSNPMALHTLEELLLLFVSFDGQGPESGFILPDVLSSIMKMLYELSGSKLFSPLIQIVLKTNGFPVGARLLSYASRLAYEAHMVGFFGGAMVDVNAITPSESGIHLLLYHVNGYLSFLHGRTENSYETIESISKAEKKLVAMLVDGAFAAYKCFLMYSRTALFKDAENSLPRLLFSDIMTCSVWERKRLKFLFSSVYSHLSDMSIGEDGIIKLLVGQLDHADLDFASAVMAKWAVSNGSMLFESLAEFSEKVEGKNGDLVIHDSAGMINRSAILWLLKYFNGSDTDGLCNAFHWKVFLLKVDMQSEDEKVVFRMF